MNNQEMEKKIQEGTEIGVLKTQKDIEEFIVLLKKSEESNKSHWNQAKDIIKTSNYISNNAWDNYDWLKCSGCGDEYNGLNYYGLCKWCHSQERLKALQNTDKDIGYYKPYKFIVKKNPVPEQSDFSKCVICKENVENKFNLPFLCDSCFTDIQSERLKGQVKMMELELDIGKELNRISNKRVSLKDMVR